MSLKDVSAVIYSCESEVLSKSERDFFKDSNPLGFILFNKTGVKNIANPDQVRRLTDDLKTTLGRNCPILIDQEGGRVQRLKPPLWREHPPMQDFGDKAKTNEHAALADLRLTITRIAEELTDAGINANCAPVLDVLTDITHNVIGDRAFSDDPKITARLAESACRTFLTQGIMPIIKHIPGHGRGSVDSHKDLPRVSASLDQLRAQDFAPFKAISNIADLSNIWAMAAHIIYENIDPDHPASVSRKVIEEIIRGEIGFNGFLVSDDIAMQALDHYGTQAMRAAATVNAGCDAALYCSGNLAEMQEIAKSVPNLSDKARKRLQNSPFYPTLSA